MDWDRMRGALALAWSILAAWWLFSGLALAQEDIFDGAQQAAVRIVPLVLGVFMMVATAVVAGSLYFGSTNAPKWVGRFIVGSFFASLGMLGTGLAPLIRRLFSFPGGSN
jgi:hypothetical protein